MASLPETFDMQRISVELTFKTDAPTLIVRIRPRSTIYVRGRIPLVISAYWDNQN